MASVFQSSTGYRDPYKAMTLKALEARAKAAQEAMAQAMQPQVIANPLQGIAGMLDVFGAGLKESRIDRAAAEGRDALARIKAQINPQTGATREQIGQVEAFDPELATNLLADRSGYLRDQANREQWQPLTQDEATAYGITGPAMINITNGEVKPLAEKGQTINVGGDSEKAWAVENAKNTSKLFDSIFAEGMTAQQRLASIEGIEAAMAGMPTGTPGALADYLQSNWGISLPGADKVAAFKAIVNTLVPTQRVAGSGTMSDKDVELFKSSLPSLVNTAEGNRLITGYMRGIAEYNAAMGQLAQQAMAIGDPNEARQWFATESQKLANPLATFKDAIKTVGGGGGRGGTDTGTGGGGAGGGGAGKPSKTPAEEEFGL